ncbi:MAG: hypothetical protein S0880_08725 [Actinomycetota bacterium]|nr:hypothetical protein [Actinomycetota bacterium]
MRTTMRRTATAIAGALVMAAGVVAGGAQPTGAQPTIVEGFTDSVGGMLPGPGGWDVSGGRYATHDPVRSGAGAIGNSNLSVHETVLSGDFGIEAVVEAEETRGAWDDFSVVLGYQDPDNYLYVSFNESNDAMTSGIFAVVDGVGTELADIDASLAGGHYWLVRVYRVGDEISAYAGLLDGPPGGAPLATATTDLFDSGRIGVGSRNNAVFVYHLTQVEPTPMSPPYLGDQNYLWGSALEAVSGGWDLAGGATITNPITSGAGTIGNSNLAVTEWGPMFPDHQEDVQFRAYDVTPPATASAWDDVSIVLGYQDPDNYLFVSLNESNDAMTSGIFAVVDGVGTELADIPTFIRGGRTYDVRVDRWGEDIWVYLDGALIGEAETDLFPKGRWGFGTRNNAGSFGGMLLEVWRGAELG